MPISTRRSKPYRGRVAREGSIAELSAVWQSWICENLLLGVARENLVLTLADNGVPPALATRSIEAVARSPLYAGAHRVTRFLRRHDVVTRMRRELEKVSSVAGAVERRTGLAREEFFDRYYAGNCPVVVTDALDAWPSVRAWSPDDFRARFAGAAIEVSAGREADPLYEPNFQAHATPTTLADFLRRIEAEPGNDAYLIANNRLTKRPEFAPLIDDLRAPHPYLDDRRDGDCVSVWIGPAGTVTPLHHDTANVFFCQVFGRKKILLFPSFELSLTHDAHHGVHSPIDPENPDLDSFPYFEHLTRKEVVLGPGEGLLIPIGYWHHVRALDTSISVSFTNLRAPNTFDWYFPGNAV